MIAGSIVDTGALLEVIWTATLAGVGVTAAYGLAILGIDRAAELGRAGRAFEATAYGVLALLSAAVIAGALVFGIVVMIDK